MNDTQNVNVQLIDRPPVPVRLGFDEAEIQALVASINERGILVPLLLRRVGDRFEVIDGDCRLEAAARLRIREVPAVVRDASDSETHVLRLLANLDRSDPDPVSEAVYIAKAISSGSITREELAEKLRRGDQWIDDRLAIAEMPDFMQEALRDKQLTLGVALALQDLPDDRLKRQWMVSSIESGTTVRVMKDAVREHLNFLARLKAAGQPAPPPESFATPPVILYPCARCGQEARMEDLRFVRVHIRDCGMPEG